MLVWQWRIRRGRGRLVLGQSIAVSCVVGSRLASSPRISSVAIKGVVGCKNFSSHMTGPSTKFCFPNSEQNKKKNWRSGDTILQASPCTGKGRQVWHQKCTWEHFNQWESWSQRLIMPINYPWAVVRPVSLPHIVCWKLGFMDRLTCFHLNQVIWNKTQPTLTFNLPLQGLAVCLSLHPRPAFPSVKISVGAWQL